MKNITLHPRYKKKKRLLPIVAAVFAVILLVGGLTYVFLGNDDKTGKQDTTSQDGIDFGPPDEQDKKDVEQNKKELSEEKDNPMDENVLPDERAAVTPVITYAGEYQNNVEVAGYVPGVFENGGKCRAEFSKGAERITKESDGFADVNRTSCTPFTIPTSDFEQKGIWSVSLSYNSSSVVGTSEPIEFEVK